ELDENLSGPRLAFPVVAVVVDREVASGELVAPGEVGRAVLSEVYAGRHAERARTDAPPCVAREGDRSRVLRIVRAVDRARERVGERLGRLLRAERIERCAARGHRVEVSARQTGI